MRITGFITMAILFCHGHIFAQTELETIKKHVEYLASEELNGRIAGTEEGRMAAAYLAKEWQQHNLTVFCDSAGYYQDFSKRKRIARPSFFISGNDTFNVTHLSKKQYFLDQANYFVSDGRTSYNEASLNETLQVIHARNLNQGVKKIMADSLMHRPAGYVIILSDKNQKRFSIKLKKFKKANNEKAVRVMSEYTQYMRDYGAYKAYCARFQHHNVFVTSKETWQKLQVNGSGTPSVTIAQEKDSIATLSYRNVICKIEGTQSDKGAIVICAHYDHIDSMYARTAKSITNYFPGADDNASGSAAVLEMAKALNEASFKPERTIYFCLFDAEEQGLYGSRHFAKAIKQEVDLVINMDMIGRNKNDKKRFDDVVFCMSSGKMAKQFNQGFDRYVASHSTALNIKRFDWSIFWLMNYFPSDNLSFRPKSETICFHTGNHDDYHTPNDTADKINYKKLTEFTRLLSLFLMQP